MTQFLIPVSNDGATMRNVFLDIPVPLTHDEWTQMHDILKAMAPALVKPEAKRSSNNPEDSSE